MDAKALQEYFANLSSTCAVENYVPRIFATRKDWDRISPLEIRRTLGVFRDSQPTLDSVLLHHNAAILGEPGMGKSTIAKAAVNHTSIVLK